MNKNSGGYSSIAHIATKLGVSTRTVRRMVEQRLIPVYHLSSKLLRFKEEEVDLALCRLRIPAASEGKYS